MLIRIWKGEVVAYLRYYPGILMKKNQESNEDKFYVTQERLNRVPTEYISSALPVHLPVRHISPETEYCIAANWAIIMYDKLGRSRFTLTDKYGQPRFEPGPQEYEDVLPTISRHSEGRTKAESTRKHSAKENTDVMQHTKWGKRSPHLNMSIHTPNLHKFTCPTFVFS
jgi:hypothetical protein